jgi:hypothetical protein
MMNSDNDCNKQLAQFLRELADSIDSKELSQEQLKHVGEFCMNYKFSDEIYEKNDKNNTDNEFQDTDIVRFLTLGWWIYKHINTYVVDEEGEDNVCIGPESIE